MDAIVQCWKRGLRVCGDCCLLHLRECKPGKLAECLTVAIDAIHTVVCLASWLCGAVCGCCGHLSCVCVCYKDKASKAGSPARKFCVWTPPCWTMR